VEFILFFFVSVTGGIDYGGNYNQIMSKYLGTDLKSKELGGIVG
jgi:hypothetical protein